MFLGVRYIGGLNFWQNHTWGSGESYWNVNRLLIERLKDCICENGLWVVLKYEMIAFFARSPLVRETLTSWRGKPIEENG